MNKGYKYHLDVESVMDTRNKSLVVMGLAEAADITLSA
jgi:hypothetical protein